MSSIYYTFLSSFFWVTDSIYFWQCCWGLFSLRSINPFFLESWPEQLTVWCSLLGSWSSFRIGCKALRLVEKLISGPQEKIMASKAGIFRKSSHHQNIFQFFETCNESCSKFFRGKSLCDPSFINRVECVKKVSKTSTKEIQIW